MNELCGNRRVLYYEFGVYRKLLAIDEIFADYAENGGQLVSKKSECDLAAAK